jgi:hypothetical protein
MRLMEPDYVECPELSGKTIQTLRIYRDTRDGTDVVIELTDGNSFTCSSTKTKAIQRGFCATSPKLRLPAREREDLARPAVAWH